MVARAGCPRSAARSRTRSGRRPSAAAGPASRAPCRSRGPSRYGMYSCGNHSWATLRWRSSRRPASTSSSSRRRRSRAGISGAGAVVSSIMGLRVGVLKRRVSVVGRSGGVGWCARRLTRPRQSCAATSVQACRDDACPYASGMPLYRLVGPLPELDGPIVLAALDGWVDAGSAATNALDALARERDARGRLRPRPAVRLPLAPPDARDPRRPAVVARPGRRSRSSTRTSAAATCCS